jgi:glycosyltransferase involved in cell wall biosynthesis
MDRENPKTQISGCADNNCKVLMIGTVYPFPATTGKKVVLAGIVSYFLERFGPRGFCYAYFGKGSERDSPEPWSHCLALGSIYARLVSALVDALLRRQKSIQEAVIYSRGLRTQIHDLILSKRPEIVVFDTIRAAQFGVPDLYAGKVVLYLDDLFSVRYRRTLDAARTDPTVLNGILGNYGIFLPPTLARLFDRCSTIKRILLRTEMNLVAKSEDTLAEKFPGPLLLSSSECEMLKLRVPSCAPVVIRPLLARSSPSAYMRRFQGSALFVFLGTLTIPANSSAIAAFIKACWADVLALMPDAKLKIIGGGEPRPELEDLIQKYSGSLEHAGFVADLAPILSNCCAMIVPLRFGTGVKLKVIDGLCYGVPIVSTRAGVDGVPVVPDRDCYVVESIEEIPRYMLALVDRRRNMAISGAASALFAREYGGPTVTATYDRIFNISVKGGVQY